MGPLFMLPPAYYRLYRPVVIPQPFSGYSSQAILNFVPDDKLGDYQRAFLSGEDLPPVGNFPPSKNPVDLSIAICQSLSACGSLKKGPTPGTGQPNQGEIDVFGICSDKNLSWCSAKLSFNSSSPMIHFYDLRGIVDFLCFH